MIVALTYGLGLGISEVAIRRLNGTRVLFGLRPRRGRAKEQPKVAFG
jgi:hypothetical protein